MKTYNKERLFVLIVLLLPLIFNSTYIELLSAIAIWVTFQHHQVASRMQEKQNRDNPSVGCHKKLNLYFYIKEILWVIFYILIEAYSGIIGSIIFLLYPRWRNYHLQRKNNF